MIRRSDIPLLLAGDLTRFDVDLSTFNVPIGTILPIRRIDHGQIWHWFEHEQRELYTDPEYLTLVTSGDLATARPTGTLVTDLLELLG